jgi:hypothetical protein
VDNAQPPLASGVVLWLHARKYFDGPELWSSMSPSMQQQWAANGSTADQVNAQVRQDEAEGISFDQFIYTGGYLSPDGSSQFLVEAIVKQKGKTYLYTWYFVTDQTGKILAWLDLTPKASSGGS